ncbi:MAG: hypothetical protein ABW224_00295 [Kibdelosporangium sp.]
MSPVSRGRKKKPTKKKRSTPPRALPYRTVSLPPLPEPPKGQWFADSVKSVLGKADVLLTASTPREVEQATTTLLGGEMHRAVHHERAGLYLSEWFKDVAAAAVAVDSETTARLLYGMTMLAPHHLKFYAETALHHVRPRLPDWLQDAEQVEATGDVWVMHDVYPSRIALIASYQYPGEVLPAAFLFDLEADTIPVTVVEPDLFGSVDQAVAAWRASVGATATGAEPVLVDSSETLQPLAQLKTDKDSVVGDETRTTMDNWFRTSRRIQDLEEAMTNRGETLFPAVMRLYHDMEIDPVVAGFTAWYRELHGTEPAEGSVMALATDWTEGVLPEFWHSVSPKRVQAQLAMFADDWIPDDPLTGPAIALLPDWVRWHGEQAGLPEHLIDRAVTTAAAGLGHTD